MSTSGTLLPGPHRLQAPQGAGGRRSGGPQPGRPAPPSAPRSGSLRLDDQVEHDLGPLGDSRKGGRGRNVRAPATCALRTGQRPLWVRSPAANSSPILASSDAVRQPAPRLSAPTRSAGGADWPPTSSALRPREPPIRSAADGSSSPRPPPRPDASTAAWAFEPDSASAQAYRQPLR